MKFALLGCNNLCLELLRAVKDHQLVMSAEEGTHLREIQKLFPQVQAKTNWEVFLADKEIDFVLIGRQASSYEEEDQLRKMVQEAIPLVLIHPACEAIFGLEMEMIRRDTGCKMISFVPSLRHPFVQQLKTWMDHPEHSPLGKIEQITCRRKMVDRARDNVINQFALDAELMRYWLSDVSKVTATGPEHQADDYQQLMVQLHSKDQSSASWTCLSGTESTATMEFSGSSAAATLHLHADYSVALDIAGESEKQMPEYQEFQSFWDQLPELLKLPADKIQPDWNSVASTLEIVDNVPYSLRRGRTIELREEELSEKSTFKGMMAAGGCFMILWSLAIMFLATLASLFDDLPAARWLNAYWPLALVAPLLIFLSLQALLLVFQQPSSEANDPVKSDKPGNL